MKFASRIVSYYFFFLSLFLSLSRRRHPRQRIAIMGSIKTLIVQRAIRKMYSHYTLVIRVKNTAQIVNALNLFFLERKYEVSKIVIMRNRVYLHATGYPFQYYNSSL